CDNSFSLYINGQKAASGKDWTKPEVVNVAKLLAKGTNTFAVHAVNDPGASKEKTDKPPPDPGPNPAGFLLQARLRYPPASQHGGPGKTVDLITDSSWVWSTNMAKNWEKPEFKAEDWTPAAELGEVSMAPWS